MTIQFYLRDTTNGYTGMYEDHYDDNDPISLAEFMWNDGNCACDCNRGLFLYQDGRDHECGSRRIVVDRAVIKETGQVVCEDDCWTYRENPKHES